MKLEFPRILRPVNLSDYHEAFGAQSVNIWVNPPVDTLRDLLTQLQAETPDPAPIFATIADLWDGWTAEDVAEFNADCEARDADLWLWMMESTFAKINEYRDERKKVLPVRSS